MQVVRQHNEAIMLWQPKTLGTVFAERELTFHKGSRTRRVILAVGRPVKSRGTLTAWWCPLEFRGLGRRRFYALAGEDTLQALLLAVNFAWKTAPRLAAEAGGTLSWLGDLDIIYDHDKIIEFNARAAGEAFGVLRSLDAALRSKPRAVPPRLVRRVARLLAKYRR
jgi:hypothetical protein